MNRVFAMVDSPWKINLEIFRLLYSPLYRIFFKMNGVKWGNGWRVYGKPILQRYRGSSIKIGSDAVLRSWYTSNPISPSHPLVISTRTSNAKIRIGTNFGITGGTICAAEMIEIGNNVLIGGNCTIIDTDFHPIEISARNISPNAGASAPVLIEDDVFIGMYSIILKGSRIGKGSVIGAGSVVTGNVPAGVVFAGNPGAVIRKL